MTADQTMGTTPNSMISTTPGVTKAQPTACSPALGLAGRPGCRARQGCTVLRGRTAGNATSGTRAARQGLVHLLRSAGQGCPRLSLAEQHRHDHLAKDGRDLRVRRQLRPSLLDV